jgi:single-strand selective monofunctional uracil DNA glycosylase
VRVVEHMRPEHVIGIGAFAHDRIRAALGPDARTGTILHPSPASPIANRGWAEQAERQLRELGVAL